MNLLCLYTYTYVASVACIAGDPGVLISRTWISFRGFKIRERNTLHIRVYIYVRDVRRPVIKNISTDIFFCRKVRYTRDLLV